MNNVLFGGVDASGRAFVHYETLGGGAGGSPRGPGASAVHVHMTNTLNTPVEALERAFPVRIERYAVRPRPPAEGHAGGAGVVRAYRFLAPAEVNLLCERRRFAPWGLNGAPDGERGLDTLVRADGTRVALPGKVTVRVEPGDTLVVETPGGGGWAPPT
jgi:N-methylhydantoinase B